jgi:hypothetical protein
MKRDGGGVVFDLFEKALVSRVNFWVSLSRRFGDNRLG